MIDPQITKLAASEIEDIQIYFVPPVPPRSSEPSRYSQFDFQHSPRVAQPLTGGTFGCDVLLKSDCEPLCASLSGISLPAKWQTQIGAIVHWPPSPYDVLGTHFPSTHNTFSFKLQLDAPPPSSPVTSAPNLGALGNRDLLLTFAESAIALLAKKTGLSEEILFKRINVREQRRSVSESELKSFREKVEKETKSHSATARE